MADEKYWSYQSSTRTPTFDELSSGIFNGDERAWNSLSPGMRREIVRSANRTHNKPLAAPGLTSYRYKGEFGYIMIGARDLPDALSEASRSLTASKARVDYLQIWNGEKYINVV